MSGAQIFNLIWGVVAVGVGLMFALRPDIVESRYRSSMHAVGLDKAVDRHAPRERVIALYRVVGVIAICLGIGVEVLLVLGVVPQA